MPDYCPICKREIKDPEFGCEPCNNEANHRDDIKEDERLFENLERGK